MERDNGKEGWGHEGGEKTIKTVDRHFGFPRLHLVITSHTHTHEFTGIVRQAEQTTRETLPRLPQRPHFLSAET